MSRRGFSLVELMVVLALLSVVAALGSLRLRRRNLQLESTRLGQELFLLATRSRLLALSSRSQVRLRIDPADADGDDQVATVHRATLPGFSPVPLAFGPALDRAAERPAARVSALVRGAYIGGARPAGPAAATNVVFAPDGSVRIDGTGASGVTIYFADERGQNPGRLVLFGRTGMAKVLAQ